MNSDASAGSSSSSSSDSVLIRVPLDQKRRKKLRAQLQEDQRRHRERQSVLAASCSPNEAPPQSFAADLLEGHDRNKSEHICVVCEHEGDDLVVCLGPCISAFHVRCLPPDSGAAAHDGAWLCPSCKTKTHACFHCKQVGVEMLADDARAATHSESLKRPVRKCRALSCGKFYHQECITQFPLARIAINTHFICPLHTCAGCNQSGAQQEAVRCMRCPVAYHARCLPRNCVRQISTKLIICPKHAGAEKEAKRGDANGGREIKQVVGNAASNHLRYLRAREAEEADEVMSETSAISGSSAKRSKEKREKREKRDKKKRKKKKKKDKQKERRESVGAQSNDEHHHRNGERGGKKRKRSKRESLEVDGKTFSQRVEKASPPATSSRRADHATASHSAEPTAAWALHSPTSSLALFESPATVNRRIQERLDEALGQSDDDDSDISMSDPSPKTKHSGDDSLGVADPGTSVTIKKEERSAGERPLTLDQLGVTATTKSSVSSSQASVVPPGERGSFVAQPSTEEDAADPKGSHDKQWQTSSSEGATTVSTIKREQLQSTEDALKLESQKSPFGSVPVRPSSSVAPASLVLKHVPSEDEYDDDEGGVGSATPPANATPRTSRAYVYGKKKRKNKVKREAQRVVKPETSEEEDDEGSEAKWVQCDSCKKWRTVPRNFDLDAMPKHWYCNMNTWDERFASCVVAEEVVKVGSSPQAGKRRYRLKNSKSTASSTGDVGGYSSSGSGPYKRSGGSMRGSAAADVTVHEEKDKNARSKNKDKTTKKRKITKQLKEKYREVKWVQCESTQCGKWRIVPASIDFDRLPAVWYCHLNTWAPELAKCSVPNPAEVNVFLLKQAKKDDRPSKKTKASISVSDPVPPVPVPPMSGGGTTPIPLVNDLANAGKSNMTKQSKGLKSTASWTRNIALLEDSTAEETCNGSNNNVEGAIASHIAKGRGGRGHNNSGNGNSTGMKKTVLEWAQCEKCNKWRKLPQHIKSSTLPDKWYCSMNHWDPTHAKCNVPEEADQEPLSLPPHPGSQWHKGGHKGQRSRRGKLSYSELLYGSTGQLRKAYTMESSTLSFEYEGMTYHRDGQYKRSSMYVSPATMAAAAATMTGWSGSDQVSRETTCSYDVTRGSGSRMDTVAAVIPQEVSVDHVAALVLESMDLRRRRSIAELFDAVNSAHDKSNIAPTRLASLAVVTAALGQLEHRGLVEKVTDLSSENGEENEPSRTRVRVEMHFNGVFPPPTHYRKVPTRPLKASKCWKFGTNIMAITPVKEA
ncbi:unnamed protein product [Hyaloperonospora brassicae]|uniref:PHD-type domain-containing protein n=1 Tax=Hyaloperonospora brassicae TaxID=162125 RepID=A0AAV0U3M0_HYABA|nr:unnamed protein product [Hyaloperonospora brassicae]